MSPGWLREWRSIFVDGMGWDEIDGRINFGLYDVVVVLDFGLEPIDDIAVLEFFDFTQTPGGDRPGHASTGSGSASRSCWTGRLPR